MIEIVTCGFFVGDPHHLGGAGAVLLENKEEFGRVQTAFGRGEVGTSVAAELVGLALALEKACRLGRDGEEVLVRTGVPALVDLCRGRRPGWDPGLEAWIRRLQDAGPRFAGVQAIAAPAWVTTQAQDLALRAAFGRARAGGSPAASLCPRCGGGKE
jgi:hypothetical protein